MEELPEPKRRKIREVVLDILNKADLETATEYTVRTNAAERLGIEILNLQEQHFIRNVIESFLLSTTEQPPSKSKANNDFVTEQQVSANPPQQEAHVSLPTENNGRTICKLSDKRRVGTFEIQGKTFVSIRDFNEKDGKLVPSASGINLSAKQWSSFRNSFPAIVEAIATMESKIRSTTDENQTVAEAAVQGIQQIQTNISQSVDHQISADRKENGDSACNSEMITNSQVQMHIEQRQQVEASSTPQGQIQQNLVPIKTIRLDGKNYYCWKHQIEFFLRQLDIAYVLSEPPNILVKAAQKWINDDYVCCHNILNSLSDKLFEKYSHKNYSAKELWEELRSSYDEDFRTTRSEVNKYLQFQMSDGISILNQVQELHKIADSIMASGILIDENFHVSAIISKLPSSWKDIRARLMHEEVMSLNMLVHHLRVEEGCRHHYRNENGATPNIRARKKDLAKKVCYNCGKEGHISKSCRETNYGGSEKGNWRENETFPVVTDTKINGKTDELVAIITGVKSNGDSGNISPDVTNTTMVEEP